MSGQFLQSRSRVGRNRHGYISRSTPETLQTLALGHDTLLPQHDIDPFTLPWDPAVDVACFKRRCLGDTVIC